MQSAKHVNSWTRERIAVIDALLEDLQAEFDACDPGDTLHWTSVSNQMSKLEDEKENLEWQIWDEDENGVPE